MIKFHSHPDVPWCGSSKLNIFR